MPENRYAPLATHNDVCPPAPVTIIIVCPKSMPPFPSSRSPTSTRQAPRACRRIAAGLRRVAAAKRADEGEMKQRHAAAHERVEQHNRAPVNITEMQLHDDGLDDEVDALTARGKAMSRQFRASIMRLI